MATTENIKTTTIQPLSLASESLKNPEQPDITPVTSTMHFWKLNYLTPPLQQKQGDFRLCSWLPGMPLGIEDWTLMVALT